jgi:recombination protein RecR
MFPQPLQELSQNLKKIPGIGQKSSQKLALDLLQLTNEQYNELIINLQEARDKVDFCQECGFFCEGRMCVFCSSRVRDYSQICLVEKPTDLIPLEKSEIYRGVYHVLIKLISPLDNVFPEHTNVNKLISRIEEQLTEKGSKEIELVLFLKPSFSADTTIAYIRDILSSRGLLDKVKLTRLATGLPLYYNTDTIDQATIVRAFEDRK